MPVSIEKAVGLRPAAEAKTTRSPKYPPRRCLSTALPAKFLCQLSAAFVFVLGDAPGAVRADQLRRQVLTEVRNDRG